MEEKTTIAMTFKFDPYIKTLLQRLAGMDDRSMTNYLEQLIRRTAQANGITVNSIIQNGQVLPKKRPTRNESGK